MPKGFYLHKKGKRLNTGKTHFKKGHAGYWVGKKRLSLTGEKHPNWKSGSYIIQGYVYLYSPEHPFCNNKGYVKRSRLVMERHLGRYLKTEEVIHHINKIKNDDSPENLQLFANNREHVIFHG